MRTLVVLAAGALVAAAATHSWAQQKADKSAAKDKPPAKVVSPAGGPKVWLAREVAQIAEQQVWLFGADGSSIGVARTEQLRALLGVFGKLEHHSGVNSELYLSEGSEPDTWLAPGKGEQIVIRVTLGLVTMLGNDWDAWAFVLAHQLAHIEFRLREKQAEAQNGPRSTASPLEEEKDADTLGLEWASRAGYKPDGAALFLNRLAARLSPTATFMRRHPFYDGRLQHVREAGAVLGPARR